MVAVDRRRCVELAIALTCNRWRDVLPIELRLTRIVGVVEEVARRNVRASNDVRVVHAECISGADAPLLTREEIREAASTAATKAAATHARHRNAARGTGKARHHTSHHAATARCTENVLKGKVLLVHVVRQTQHRDSLRLAEVVERNTGIVAVVETIPTIGATKRATAPVLLRRDVHRLLRVAIVEATKHRQVTTAVEHLHTINHVGRQVLERRRRIITKEFTSVNRNATKLLALRLDGAIFNRDARHLLYKVFGACVRIRLKGRCIVFGGVTFDFDADSHAFDIDLAVLHGIALEFEGPEVRARLPREDRLLELLKPHIRDRHPVGPRRYVLYTEAAIALGECAFHDG